MDPMEQMLLRLHELQPEVPSWAKAEQMEISVPQTELWKYPAKAIQEAPQDQEAADGDVQESSIRQTRVFLTEYGAIWRREFFLPLLMIGY